jgi:hypothetical protein
VAKLFIQEFKAANGSFPDFYAANLREHACHVGVHPRVIAKGGNVNSGDDLDKALQDNLTVVSVYGGDSNTVGSYVLDPSTHSVKRRNMGVFTYKSGKVKAQALSSTAPTSRWLEIAPLALPQLLGRSRVTRSILQPGPTTQCIRDGQRATYGLLGTAFALILGVTGRFHYAFGILFMPRPTAPSH